MTHKNHDPVAPVISRLDGHIGKPPRSQTAQALRQGLRYARDHWGAGQIYTFAGPVPRLQPETNPDYDFMENYGGVVEFPVILHAPPKTDSSVSHRQLVGKLWPWRQVPKQSFRGGYVDEPCKIYWRHLYKTKTVNRQLLRTGVPWPIDYDKVDHEYDLKPDGIIDLFDYDTPNLFHDGACELTTADLIYMWDTGNAGTLSRDTTNYRSGSQSIKIMCTGTANPYADGPYLDRVAQLVVGARYSFACWCRGDGSAAPKVLSDTTTIATGTSSTSWQFLDATFVAEATTLKFEATTSTSSQYVNFDSIHISELGRFRYEPDADGEFTVGFLGVERMAVAAVAICTAPDRAPTDDQVVVKNTDMLPGRAIRGRTGTGQGSIGDIEYMAGKGGADLDVDDLERNTRRCLCQSGHPLGLSYDGYSAWYNIRGGHASYFRATPRNLTGLSTGSNVSTIPALYGWCQGAAVGNEGYVKYTATTSGDTWTYTIDSDTPGLWTDSNRLDIDSAGDTFKIEVKAPPGGWIAIGAYSLWEDGYDQ